MEENQLTFLEKILIIPEKKGWHRRLILIARIILVSLNRFIKDDCLVKASSIAYTTIISLVPTLTVGLALVTLTSGFDSKKEELFAIINTNLNKYNIPIDISPYLQTLDDLVNSATQIGAIGFIVLIFSATAVLRTFETAFNHIWRIANSRSFFNKLIFYFFIMSIGPLLLIVVTGYAIKFSDSFRTPHYHSMHLASNRLIWIGGERGILYNMADKLSNIQKLDNRRIDFENLNCFSTTGTLLQSCERPDFKNQHFIKIEENSGRLFALTEEGIILYSDDLGSHWSIDSYINVQFKDFSVRDKNTIFILNKNGKPMVHHPGASDESLNLEFLKTLDVRKIYFYNETLGFILDKKANLFKTEDGGKTFQKIQLEDNGVYTEGEVDIYDIYCENEQEYIVTGNRGRIFHSLDGGNHWNLSMSHRSTRYEKIWKFQLKEKSVYLVLNDVGNLLYSFDRGRHWHLSYANEKGRLLDIIHIENHKLVKQVKSGQLIAIGEFKLISVGIWLEDKLYWKPISGGVALFSIYNFIRILLPLAAIWLFFIFLYSLIPNTRVSFRAVSVGSAVTGIVLLLFMAIFGIYIRSFSATTMIIYQALAAVPIFLLSIYSLSIIILFGAELTATIDKQERYLLPVNPFEDIDREPDFLFFNLVKLLVEVYRFPYQNKVLISEKILQEKLKISGRDFKEIISLSIHHGFLIYGEDKEIVPVLPADAINLHDIFQKVFRKLFRVPDDAIDLPFAKILKKNLGELDDFTRENLKKIYFCHLLSESSTDHSTEAEYL